MQAAGRLSVHRGLVSAVCTAVGSAPLVTSRSDQGDAVRPPRTLLQSRSETSISPDLCWALGEQAVGRSRSGSHCTSPHFQEDPVSCWGRGPAQPCLPVPSLLRPNSANRVGWAAACRRPLRAHPTGLFTAARPHFTYRKPPCRSRLPHPGGRVSVC